MSYRPVWRFYIIYILSDDILRQSWTNFQLFLPCSSNVPDTHYLTTSKTYASHFLPSLFLFLRIRKIKHLYFGSKLNPINNLNFKEKPVIYPDQNQVYLTFQKSCLLNKICLSGKFFRKASKLFTLPIFFFFQ